MSEHRFPYRWQMGDLKRVRGHKLRAFSVSACGGGSALGYRMAGFRVVGGSDEHRKMLELFKTNLVVELALGGSVEKLAAGPVPEGVEDIDVLDWGCGAHKQGSPEEMLRFLGLVDGWKPKACVMEGGRWLLTGRAKGYCSLVRDRFSELGYDFQLFALNAASMGVPQAREGVFFLARRRDMGFPPIRFNFSEETITFRESCGALPFQELEGTEPDEIHTAFWRRTRPGYHYPKAEGYMRLSYERPVPAIHEKVGGKLAHPAELRTLSWVELCLANSYPYDYGFGEEDKVGTIGLGAPPVMVAQVASQVAQQWFQVPREKIDWKESG